MTRRTALKNSFEFHPESFSLVTLRVATFKLPGMIFLKFFSSQNVMSFEKNSMKKHRIGVSLIFGGDFL